MLGTAGRVLSAPARVLSMLVLALSVWGTPVQAQQTQAVETSQPKSVYAVLLGQWFRPDGGYIITIKGVEADGKLVASYANPHPLPFSTAEASLDGKVIKVFFELRAGGYAGSTYTLSYDPAADVLRGVYHQAVANEKYDIQFQRIGEDAHEN